MPLNPNDSDQDIGAQFKLNRDKISDGDSSYAPDFGKRAPRRGVAESGETNRLLNKKDPFASLDTDKPGAVNDFAKAMD